ncbi:MoaD/ThiS family protein [Nitrosopumilus sp. K4]|uniref:KEOPS complex subunit Cgi121 n=1 Tax=Nitrosopumilus sp. K4 TaxID=2795383 RepID=UPI001BA4ECC0|nr:KEOPS complex subunit Cgi121 [Nitrosopumilus sp. K4]QUC64912.1 MoaD/ThiS family protein [Nitrosopumilus sp. K4]
MITVKFLGGAKKSFSTDHMEIQKSNISIDDLLGHLTSIKPQTTLELDTDNILIAVNGIDSSAMDGKMTIIKDGDTVSIIPVIHGGSPKRVIFSSSKKNVQLLEIKGDKKIDVSFLDGLRKRFPKLIIQAVSSEFILNTSHAKKIISLSLICQKNDNLLSKKLETDILMRFGLTSQISDAIKIAGIKPKKNFFVVSIGPKKELDSLYLSLKPSLSEIFSKNHSFSIKKQFRINKRQIDCVLTKTPLEDILVERASVLL